MAAVCTAAEVPRGDLLLHVLLCLLGADEGDADLGLNDLIGFGGEVEGGSDGCIGADCRRPLRRSGSCRSRSARFGGRVEHHVVVDLVLAASVPAAGEARHSLDLVIGGEVNLRAEKLL